MKKVFINSLKEKDRISEDFLIKQKKSAVTRTGSSYLQLFLMDRTGEIPGMLWDNADEIDEKINTGDIVHVDARVSCYQGKLQLTLNRIEPLERTEVSLEDFLPTTSRDIGQMMEELRNYVLLIENPFLREILVRFFDDEDFCQQFQSAPAAKKMHHAYLGGLLEHTLSATHLVTAVAAHYSDVNRDLLITSTILHDIGKVYEFDYDGPIEYTDEGRLIGHITIGVEMVEDKIVEIPEFPPTLALHLKHIILSHHGQLEFGSPILPMTREALIIHQIEDLDAKINSVQCLMENKEETSPDWTLYSHALNRFFFKRSPEDISTDSVPEEPAEALSHSSPGGGIPDLFGEDFNKKNPKK